MSEPLDERPEIPMIGPEREQLDAWIEMYRLTVFMKVDGLSGEQLSARSVPPSTLSLIGIVRHLTEVERYWLREVVHGVEMAELYCSEVSPEGDFADGTPESAAADIDTYRAELDRCRSAIADWADLDSPVKGMRHGKPISLRWILVHLIEEYARHLGHMDLLREAIDGSTGY